MCNAIGLHKWHLNKPFESGKSEKEEKKIPKTKGTLMLI